MLKVAVNRNSVLTRKYTNRISILNTQNSCTKNDGKIRDFQNLTFRYLFTAQAKLSFYQKQCVILIEIIYGITIDFTIV